MAAHPEKSEPAGAVFVPDWIRWFLPVGIFLFGLVHWLLVSGLAEALVNGAASLASAIAVLAAFYWRRNLYQASAWLLVGLAGISSFTGHLLWYLIDLEILVISAFWPYVSYLLTYGLLVAGLWRFGQPVESSEGALIDSLMLVVAAAVLFWAVMIQPYLGQVGLIDLLMASLYPLADLLLLAFTLKLYFLGAKRSRALLLLIAAVATLLLADLLHAYGVSSGRYERGGALDLLWYLVYALIAAAAWHPSATQKLVETSVSTHQAFIRLLVIGLVSISVPAMILLAVNSSHELVKVGALASIALFILMLFRMTFLLRRNYQQAETMEMLVRTDPLTGAANRRWLEEYLEAARAQSQETGIALSVICLDLDHFKQFNDELGHAEGDRLLVSVVSRWKQQLDQKQLLARTGGEEFVIVCPEMTLQAAESQAKNLLAVVPFQQTCSAGVTSLKQQDNFDRLLQRADQGLYRAKAAGRNQVVVVP